MNALQPESKSVIARATRSFADRFASLFVFESPEQKDADRRSAPGQALANTGRNKETSFSLVAPAARNVYLAADFTGWDKSPVKMASDCGGVWRITVLLPPGRYHYRFLIEIDLECARRNGARIPLPFGALQGVAEVAA